MPSVSLHLQDPTTVGRTLLDLLAEAAGGAEAGGGIFAFASRSGIGMLLGDPAVQQLTRDGQFELVVGVDSVTNERALEALAESGSQRPGLSARVLVHDLPSLFHPKLCWFRSGDTTTLVLGSGNLTAGGLARNLEAFTVTSFEGSAGAEIELEIASWLERWEHCLLAPDAPAAIACAKSNSGSERSFKQPMRSEDELGGEAGTPPPDAAVLVAEIPRNAPRRTQLDVGVEQFRDFFGGELNKEKRIVIQHVEGDGALGEIEPPRALFPTKSRNYRFEAAAGRGIEYPAEGRPIGVFVHLPDGIFRYRLLWPGAPGHSAVEGLLTDVAGPARGNAMRRETVTLDRLGGAWPDSPLLPSAAASS